MELWHPCTFILDTLSWGCLYGTEGDLHRAKSYVKELAELERGNIPDRVRAQTPEVDTQGAAGGAGGAAAAAPATAAAPAAAAGAASAATGAGILVSDDDAITRGVKCRYCKTWMEVKLKRTGEQTFKCPNPECGRTIALMLNMFERA